MSPRASAGREAFEEAGVIGHLGRAPVGSYRQLSEKSSAPGVSVLAFPLEVVDELPVWQEMGQRKRRWFTIKQAQKVVRDKNIAALLSTFERAVTEVEK